MPILSQAQNIEYIEVSAGPVLPIGKELKNVYSMGLRLSIGPRIRVKNIGLVPEVNFDLYVNNQPRASSNIKDNLLLYSLQLKASYAITMGKIILDPLIGVGFGWGTNFFTNRTADFTGGYFSEKVTIMKMHGVNYSVGFSTRVSKRISVGIQYRINQPKATLTDEAKAGVLYNISTQLYGPILELPSQKMKLDNMSLNVTIRL